VAQTTLGIGLLWLLALSSDACSQSDAAPIIVVELDEWIAEAKKIAGDDAEFRVWKSDRPAWFAELVEREVCILVLSDPTKYEPMQKMWRERLAAQGCKLFSLHVARSTGIVEPKAIRAGLYTALIEHCPERKSRWDENLRRATRDPQVRQPQPSISWFANRIWASIGQLH